MFKHIFKESYMIFTSVLHVCVYKYIWYNYLYTYKYIDVWFIELNDLYQGFIPSDQLRTHMITLWLLQALKSGMKASANMAPTVALAVDRGFHSRMLHASPNLDPMLCEERFEWLDGDGVCEISFGVVGFVDLGWYRRHEAVGSL